MRANVNGSNNHVNGSGANRLGRFDFDDTPETSADERSRSRGAGGYGGFGAQQPEQLHGPPRVERQNANRRSGGQNDWNTSRSRSRTDQRYGAAGGQVDGKLVPNTMSRRHAHPVQKSCDTLNSSGHLWLPMTAYQSR